MINSLKIWWLQYNSNETPSLLERFPLLPLFFVIPYYSRGAKAPASSRDIRTSRSGSGFVAYWFPYLFPRVKPDWLSCGWFSSPVCLGICSPPPTIAARFRWSFWSNAWGFREVCDDGLSTETSRVNRAAFLVSAAQRHPFDFSSVLG